MASNWQDSRPEFRHGNLPSALIEAALSRLETDGSDAISLRDLAKDVGVNHRAVYRHFPDKLSLMAGVAEAGWALLERTIMNSMAGRKPGEESLVAGGVAVFVFARTHPNLFQLMGGPRFHANGDFPNLDEAIGRALGHLRRGFIDAGTTEKAALHRTLIYTSALQGIVSQILVKRFRLAPAKAEHEVAEICRMLIKGLR